MLALTIVFALGSTAGLPDGIRKALETQLPAWAAVGGNPAPSSEGMERIAVERTSGPVWKVFLLERKIRAEVRAEGNRNWLTEATWCGAGADRCDDVWSRNSFAKAPTEPREKSMPGWRPGRMRTKLAKASPSDRERA